MTYSHILGGYHSHRKLSDVLKEDSFGAAKAPGLEDLHLRLQALAQHAANLERIAEDSPEIIKKLEKQNNVLKDEIALLRHHVSDLAGIVDDVQNVLREEKQKTKCAEEALKDSIKE